MKVLLADDDDASRRLLTSQVVELGFEAIQAADGEEAWEAFLVHRPEIVLTDWSMPRLDGLGLCRRVRELGEGAYVYIIVVTAMDQRVGFLEAMGAGADDFLGKPCDLMELNVRIRVACRILDLQNHVSHLEGLLPICPSCRRIQDERSDWQQVESFVSRRSEAQFSHGICPECYESVMKPQVEELRRAQPRR
jgi:sigma-B regulation protein RsbU (phosphoserine phosphatase)